MKRPYSLPFLCMTALICQPELSHAQQYHRDMQVRQRPVSSAPNIRNAPEGYGYQGYRQPYQVNNAQVRAVQPVRPVPMPAPEPAAPLPVATEPVTLSRQQQLTVQHQTPPSYQNIKPVPMPAPDPVAPLPVATKPMTLSRQQQLTARDNLSQEALEKQRNWEKFIPSNMRNVYKPKAFNAMLFTGYRIDNVTWDVAGFNIPKLSELVYENIGSAEIGLQADYTVQEGLLAGLYAEGRASYAKTFFGSHEDLDFLRELPIVDDTGNPTGETATGIFEFSRTSGDSDDGNAHNLRAALGYEVWRYTNSDTSAWITPIAGYAYNKLDITMTNGEIRNPRGGLSNEGEAVDIVETIPVIDGTPFQGLDSAYNTEWKGPFVGATGGYHFENHQFNLRGEVHFVDYEAEAEWNLRTDFAQPRSFAHQGEGFGYEIGLDYSYYFTDDLALIAGASYRDFSIDDGTDTIYLSNGSVISLDRLNNVNWTSQLYRIGGKYSF